MGGRVTPGEVDAYLYTERGIYRPGETVHLTAMMRDRAGRAIADRNGTLITYRPNGMESFRVRFAVDNSGTIQRDIELPRSAARGMWRTTAEIDGIGQVGSIARNVGDLQTFLQARFLDLHTDVLIETELITVTIGFAFRQTGLLNLSRSAKAH